MEAVQLSHRYIADRFLPDKAVDLMDEAASPVRMQIDTRPIGNRRPRAPADAAAAGAACPGQGEGPGQPGPAGGAGPGTGGTGRGAVAGCGPDGSRRRRPSRRPGPLQKRLDDLRIELEQAKAKGEYEKASRLEYGELPALEKQIAQAANVEGAMLRLEVAEADVAAVVSKWTGIPAGPPAWKVRWRSCCTWKSACGSGWWARIQP